MSQRKGHDLRCFLGLAGQVLADEDVDVVGVVGAVLIGSVILQEVRDCDAQLRHCPGLLFPEIISVGIGKGDDVALLEDIETAVELRFAAGGEPDVFGHQCAADDCGFL